MVSSDKRSFPAQVDKSLAVPGMPQVHSVVHHRGPTGNRPGHFRVGQHRTHVIACHLRADGRYRLGSEIVTMRAPLLCLLAAGEVDGNGLLGTVDVHWCLFDSPCVSATPRPAVALRLGEDVLERSHVRTLRADETALVINYFRDLRRANNRADAHSRLTASARVVDLLALWAKDSPGNHQDSPVAVYRDLIEKHATDVQLSLSDLAQRAQLDGDHLGVLFRREHGLSPMEFRMRVRLLRAREALSAGQSVSASAQTAGIADVKYFARVFRSRYGMTPSAFARTTRLQ